MGGGGRPPVNIEINFVPGSGPNALKEAREDAKALKADLDALSKHSMIGGGGPVVGGTSSPVGRSGAAGTAGAAAPSFIAGRRSRFSASEVSFEASETARATQRVTEANRALASSARDVATAYVAMNTAKGTGATIGLGPDPSKMRPIDVLHANIQRRRQGLPDLPDPTIAAAAANVAAGGAAGAYGSGVLGTGIAASVAIPAGILAALGGVAAARTPQGTAAIGGLGGWLEGATREEGFAQQLMKSFGSLTGANVTGQGNWRNPVQWYRDTMLTPWVDEAQTGAGVNRMLAGQSASNVGYRLGQMSELSSTGVGMDALAAARAQNQMAIGQLEDRVFGRASSAPSDRIQDIESLKGVYREQLSIKHQELAVAQSILDTRRREQDVINQNVGSLASMSTADLRRAERAYQSSRDGTVTEREAQILMRVPGGRDLPAVQDRNLSRAMQYAPGLTGETTKEVARIREESEKASKEIAALTKEIGSSGDGLRESMTGLFKVMVERFDSLDGLTKDAIAQVQAGIQNAGVKNGQGSKAPGVRGPGQAR